MEDMNLIELLDRFPDEQSCRDFIQERRWPNEITCPQCGVIGKAYKYSSGKNSGKLFKCAACRQQFTVRVGSIFEDSKIPLRKWLLAIYLCTSIKKGVSSIQLAKFIKVRQATAWFMLQRIRHVFESGSFEKLSGEVEMDEAYIGGSDKNKHHSKKLKTLTGKGAQGHGSKNSKTPVVGMVERGGDLHAVVTDNTGSATLMNLVRKHIDIDATVYTDEHMPYRTLSKIGFKHESVNHGVKEFVNGMASTNTAESFWSHLKRGINGIYHHVSPKHLQKYCDEYSYRWNTREMTDGERFEDWFGNLNGKRLTYKALIEKQQN
jgi:transposase-like protein